MVRPVNVNVTEAVLSILYACMARLADAAMISHVYDSFVGVTRNLLFIPEPARSGAEPLLKEDPCEVPIEYACPVLYSKLIYVSTLLLTVSDTVYGRPGIAENPLILNVPSHT
jgi:hypothetical protein